MPGVSFFTRHIRLFTSLTAVVLLAVVLFLPLFKGVTITDYKAGRILYFHAAAAGDIFSVHYIHSVNKSPVEDFFVIGNNNELILEKTVFKSFGAGVPASSEDGGELKVYNDRLEVTGINRRIDNFLLFVGVTAEHRFKIAEDEFPLRSISRPQRNLVIRMDKISLVSFIKLRQFN